MKRLIILITAGLVAGSAAVAVAGDYHTGTSLICSDCHVAHYSQQHGYGGATFAPLGPSGPYSNLLRDDDNKVCLACHNGTSFAPDVFGADGLGAWPLREAGGLNALAGTISNDAGYDETDGHTLYSKATPPGGNTSAYVPNADLGLRCVDCHAQHGTTNYRNLLNRGIFAGDTVSYVIGSGAIPAPDLTKDVYEVNGALKYTEADVQFLEPDTHNSHYAQWCKACHVDFHGKGGDPNMGGLSGGVTSSNATPWKRHPTADVNLGESGSTSTYISSLARYQACDPNLRVKMMDSQGTWAATNTTLTPSCFSCHKAHGNKNPFGLIFMKGTAGGTRTEEGDGGVYKDLCRQCHSEGA